jgi:6,7-dimethyl-8-ribityllumazine synthase
MAQRAAAGPPRPAAKSAPAGLPDGRGLKVVVLRSSFNAGIVDGLLEGALSALDEMGTSRAKVTVVDVPGAFELPLAAQAAARGHKCDAVIALGAVIRGQTDHYEHIARAATDGLSRVALSEGVPVGFGVLTVGDEQQALERAAPGPENKGAEAARAAVAMVHVLRRLKHG